MKNLKRIRKRDSPVLGQIWKLEYEGEMEVAPETTIPAILLKVQIFSNTSAAGGKKLFRSRIYRFDCFKVRPFTRPEDAVHEWFVSDDNFEIREFKASSVSQAVKVTVEAIRDRLRK